MPAELDCIVAGDANVDLLMTGVPRVEFDKELLAKDMNLVLGGSSSITAFNLARLGTRVGFASVVGRDTFGDFVEARLKSAKIDVTGLRRVREKTGITIWHEHGKHRAGVTYPGTVAMFQASDVSLSLLKRARHLHVGAYFLLENLHPGAASLFRRAHKLGLTTSLDCNYDPKEKWDSGLRDLLPHVDIFLPNETEACAISGLSDGKLAAADLSRQARIVVVKRGAHGATISTGGMLFSTKAVKVKVVDTTGAGDSFNAGFLSAYLKGQPLKACAAAGVEAGARAVTMAGGTAAFEKPLR